MRDTKLDNRAYVAPVPGDAYSIRIQHPEGGYEHIATLGFADLANTAAKSINDAIDRALKQQEDILKRKQTKAQKALTDLLDAIEATD